MGMTCNRNAMKDFIGTGHCAMVIFAVVIIDVPKWNGKYSNDFGTICYDQRRMCTRHIRCWSEIYMTHTLTSQLWSSPIRTKWSSTEHKKKVIWITWWTPTSAATTTTTTIQSNSYTQPWMNRCVDAEVNKLNFIEMVTDHERKKNKIR